MVQEKLKQIKAVYYPYKFAKKVILELPYCFKYLCSLHYIKKNKKRVQEKIDNKEILNVVFIVQYIPGWNKLEPIYKKMKQDNRFNPVILCVPLNIKNHKLMECKGNDTYDYFVNHGYDAINSLQTATAWYDLKQLKPDYVFHSRPYNFFMPEDYTSRKIVKFALICNIIYGTCMTRNSLDVTLNKDYFRDTYMYYAFDESEKIFYDNRYKLGIKRGIQKCFPFGATGLEEIAFNSDMEELHRTDKKVLWTPRWSTDSIVGGSNFFKYKDSMFYLASKYADVHFIFRPHPLTFENFIKTGEMTEKEVQEFKKKCFETKNITLDESKNYTKTFWQTDFIISDPSGIIPEYYITNHPIIYCVPDINMEYTDYCKTILKNSYEVKNEKELLLTFEKLYNNIDNKSDARKESIQNMFGNINECSNNILESMYKILV